MSETATMPKLTPAARSTIKGYFPGVTIAGYVRHTFPDGVWGGDECGCTDDRCIGYHHDETDECGCLPVCVERYYLEAVARVVYIATVTGDGHAEWLGALGDRVYDLLPFASPQDAERLRPNWERLGYRFEVREQRRRAS